MRHRSPRRVADATTIDVPVLARQSPSSRRPSSSMLRSRYVFDGSGTGTTSTSTGSSSNGDHLVRAIGAAVFVFSTAFLAVTFVALVGPPPTAGTEDSASSIAATATVQPVHVSSSQALSPTETSTRRSRRFPLFGTEEFAKTCSFLSYNALPSSSVVSQQDDAELYNCTLLARPAPKSNEGLSTWTAEIAAATIYAAQARCNVVLDYGPGVDVAAVFASPSKDGGQGRAEWEIPDGYICSRTDACFHVGLRNERMVQSLARDIERSRTDRIKSAEKELRILERSSRRDTANIDVNRKVSQQKNILERHQRLRDDGSLLPQLATVPHYRFQYNPSRDTDEERKAVANLETLMPGFHLDIGMACALGRTIDFAPSASNFAPTLYTHILPTLRDTSNLVIAVYIRTGNTDIMAKLESEQKEAGAVDDDSNKKDFRTDRELRRLDGNSRSLINCAMAIELEQLSKGSYSKSIWLVITDSPSVGETTRTTYGGEIVKGIKRELITTGAKGIQTRPARSPGTEDWAEAAIDWMLLGESNVIVSASGYSFADTGALRTARPVFSPRDGGCVRRMIMPTGAEPFGDDEFGHLFQGSYDLK
mmetsp:Transcript_22459/g.48780  ORF Transcript_22459/g.48780 Transcript_22459/m.48780 type:complete len:593 (-) Transcript_22459:72-1850(-)